MSLEKFLGLNNFVVDNLEIKENDIFIYGRLERLPQVCPHCKSNKTINKGYYTQTIKDVPTFDKNIFIRIKKRRYVCSDCRKTFYEQNDFLMKYYRYTKRFLALIFRKTATVSSFADISRDLNISLPTLLRKFDILSYPKADLRETKVLSIDEFKGNTNGEKYNCILADPKRRKVLDILPKRYKVDLENYFLEFPKKERDNVEIFVSDMWRPYYDIKREEFKNATFVVDKYHWMRQVFWAFENIRKEEQKNFSVYSRRYFKKSKSLLNKKFEFLSDEDKQAVNIMLYKSERISSAYALKEMFLKIFDEKTQKERKKKLSDWIFLAQKSDLKPFIKCSLALSNWSEGISNSLNIKYTNGFIEGCNNKIKVLKRNAYGYKNFRRFRNRILHIFNY